MSAAPGHPRAGSHRSPPGEGSPVSGGSFSADWLRQREPFDAEARQTAAARLLPRLQAWRPPDGRPWRVIDLACGTGANLRWLAPRLGGPQQWLVVDHDAALLRCWPERLGLASEDTPARQEPLVFDGPGFEARIVRQQADLATQLEALPWHAAGLVTASALLDLVGADWLDRLASSATSARVALLLALSVDGRHLWSPPDPLDATVGRLFADHQRRDKGLGPALGAAAVAVLRARLQAEGYQVFSAASDWRIDGSAGPQDVALQRALIDGIAAAATEQSPDLVAALRSWRQRRRALCATARLRVGHVDLLALPPEGVRG